ncbi:MAG TPA: hypothetical protein VJ728_02920 [Candidatus Binataceae bacterium]|nr:hypothetical protein [Candidatus Binataceae bacterium]
MEFRVLSTETERTIFVARLEQARSARGAIFRETSQAQLANRRRLDSSTLYGLFENDNASADKMIAGIAMHDLQSFPQSCSAPDLSYLPAHTVIECSDHWSLSNGPGMLAWAGLAIPMRLIGARAILAYLAVSGGESDHAGFYASMGFMPAGPPVLHPFVEDERGDKLPVQPMVLEGEALEKVIAAFAKACIEYSDDARVFHLRNFVRPMVRRASLRKQPSVPAPADTHSSEVTKAID